MPRLVNFAMFVKGSGSSATGFAYNAGIGLSSFISPNVAFEITGRYEGGSLNGDEKILVVRQIHLM
jgi:hypothetical protein